ncbi:MAG: DEAD/DEAH box helicase [Acidimicrobiaceae bacterium]|nr:DEAD/DEAH box helicase [Acidimicrobiaceae bacterium]
MQTISPHYPLHPFQRQVLHDLLTAVSGNKLQDRRVVVHLPTGAGKTRIASHAAASFLNDRRAEGKVFLWLAASEELCEQAAQSLTDAWCSLGNRVATMYRYWGDASLELGILDEGFVVAGLQKLWSAANSRLSAGEHGFLTKLGHKTAGVVFDEAHQAIAPTYRFLAEQLSVDNPPMIGLTATPGRTWRLDGDDYDLAEMFGEQKVTIDPRGHDNSVAYLITNGYLAAPEFVQVNVDLDERIAEPDGTGDYRKNDLRMIGNDPTWFSQVVELTLDALARHDRVMVFCPSVPNALEASREVRRKGFRSAAIVAGTPSKDRDTAISVFRASDAEPMALFNFGVLTAGFDAPKTRCVIVARPTTSLVLYSQMVGRAMRGPRSGGNRHCEVLTVIDTRLKGFGSVAEAFTNWEELWQKIN